MPLHGILPSRSRKSTELGNSLAVGTRKTSVFGMYQVGTLMYFVCNHQLHKLHKSTNAKVSAPRCTLVTNWCTAHCSQHHSNLALNCPRRRCASVVPWLLLVPMGRCKLSMSITHLLRKLPQTATRWGPSNYIDITSAIKKRPDDFWCIRVPAHCTRRPPHESAWIRRLGMQKSATSTNFMIQLYGGFPK